MIWISDKWKDYEVLDTSTYQKSKSLAFSFF